MLPLRKSFWLSCVLTGVFATTALAFPSVAPAEVGFSADRLQRLDAVVEKTIAEGRLAGALAYIARDGKQVRLTAYGLRDQAAGIPMQPDTLFRIASMSKAVTSVAVMMLYEEGHFSLNDPVSKYIPSFANSVVAVPAPAGSPEDVKFITVKAKRGITIRDLLCHTAGLTYGDGPAVDLYKKAKLHGWYLSGHNETIAEVVDRLATLPLQGQPGEAFQYGYATDVLGRLVEVVSGLPLDRFFAERIFQPLGMVDSCFFLSPDKANRLMPVYGLVNGALTVEETSARSDFIDGPRKCFSGGAGLISSAQDYGRFLQMLVNRGELDGVRLLSPLTVDLMSENHTGTLFGAEAKAFGLGFWVNQDSGLMGELCGEGAYGWGSAYYPQYFVDPKNRLVGIFFTQLKPAGDLTLNRRFRTLVYQALVQP